MQYTILEVYRHNLYHECFTRPPMPCLIWLMPC